MLPCRWLAVKCRSHNPVDADLRDVHIAVLAIGFTKSPLIIGRARAFACAGVAHDRPIIPNRIALIIIDAIHLALAVIYVDFCHDAPHALSGTRTSRALPVRRSSEILARPNPIHPATRGSSTVVILSTCIFPSSAL